MVSVHSSVRYPQTMLMWLLFFMAHAQDPPSDNAPAEEEPAPKPKPTVEISTSDADLAPVSSGSMLRSLLLDSGVGTLIGAPQPTPFQGGNSGDASPESAGDDDNPNPHPAGPPPNPVEHNNFHVEAPPGAPQNLSDASPSQPGQPLQDVEHSVQPHSTEHVHTVAPPGEGNRPSPGFAFSVRLPPDITDVTIVVGEKTFVPSDDGQGEDKQAGDGIWTAVIERYSATNPIEVHAGGVTLYNEPIAIVQTRDIPRMFVDLQE